MDGLADIVGVEQLRNGVGRAFFSPPNARLSVEFYKEASETRDVLQSQEAGYSVFPTKEYIKIFIDSKSTHVREVTEEDRAVYAHEYGQFLRGEEQRPEGTLLSFLGTLSPSQIKELKHNHNIHTVEQLAGTPPERIDTMMWGAKAIGEAQVFLKTRTDTGFAQQLAAQKNDLEDQLSALREEIAALKAEKIKEEKKKKEAH